MASAELSLWARSNELTSGTVDWLLWQDGDLVKTWAIRGTLHLIPARSCPSWQGHCRPTGTTSRGLAQAFGMNGPLTREELSSRVGELSGDQATSSSSTSSSHRAAADGTHVARMVATSASYRTISNPSRSTMSTGAWPQVHRNVAYVFDRQSGMVRGPKSFLAAGTREVDCAWPVSSTTHTNAGHDSRLAPGA